MMLTLSSVLFLFYRLVELSKTIHSFAKLYEMYGKIARKETCETIQQRWKMVNQSFSVVRWMSRMANLPRPILVEF